ncbi:hypothetical protein TUZN_2242 [Thermoproteus uzoniensis 768-20]|uniref:Uncharacterized protein n=1 Tax=Thermoproteus uzoniensis (strain 768-20) TaxID=999630 RepID=F2L677_THEU7|nr:hypothetical protein TUZN_2242 [Thermoproteus uzoniensis 768-20]
MWGFGALAQEALRVAVESVLGKLREARSCLLRTYFSSTWPQ